MSRKKIEIPGEPPPITRMRERHSHALTDKSKVEQIKTLAVGYQDLVRATAHRYWAAEHMPLVLGYPQGVVTARRQNGESAACPLPSHYQAQAVFDGLDVIRASWKQTFAAVRSKAGRRFPDSVGEDDQVVQNPIRHEVNWLLCWPELLVRIMTGEVVSPIDKEGKQRPEFAENDHVMICRWLNRTLHGLRAGQPQIKHRLRQRSACPAKARPGIATSRSLSRFRDQLHANASISRCPGTTCWSWTSRAMYA
jgi:hypothetical protein